jgi:hypothetical protein
MSPLGKDLIHSQRDASDYDDTAEDFSNESVVSPVPPPGPDFEDAVAEEEPCTKHDPCFELDGDKVYKARYLNQLFAEYKTPGSRDRLKRVANIPRYAVKRNITSDIVDHDYVSGTPTIQIDSPIVTLVKCEDHIFLCVGEVNDISFDSNHLEELAIETLTEPSTFVSFQLLFLVPASTEDDPGLKHDWRWSGKRGESLRASGRLVEPINPAVCTRNAGGPFYLFESGVLMAIGSTIFERICPEDGRLLPVLRRSDFFPYREETGKYHSKQYYPTHFIDDIFGSGKACFVCEHDGKARDLIKGRQCPNCPDITVELSKPQRILEHAAAHILFDSTIDATSEPCGLCLRPSPLCAFYLKKAKGSDGSLRINYNKSNCANMLSFSYTVAAVSTNSSPCSNVPVQCPWCPQSSPAIWRYNIYRHIKNRHAYVSLKDHEDIWKIGNSEKDGLKKVWDSRHKAKKARKKRNQLTPLLTSEAHTSHRVLRYAFCHLCNCILDSLLMVNDSITTPAAGAHEDDENGSRDMAGADEENEHESDAESSADSAVSTVASAVRRAHSRIARNSADESDSGQSNAIGDEEVEDEMVFGGNQGGIIDSGTKGDKQVSTKTPDIGHYNSLQQSA